MGATMESSCSLKSRGHRARKLLPAVPLTDVTPSESLRAEAFPSEAFPSEAFPSEAFRTEVARGVRSRAATSEREHGSSSGAGGPTLASKRSRHRTSAAEARRDAHGQRVSASRADFETQAEFESGYARPHLAKTFDVAELEQDFISFCQLTSHATWAQAEAESCRLKLLRQVTGHVHLPEFDAPGAASEICGTTLLQPLQSAIEVDPWSDARSIYARLCATRLLTAGEEYAVMRRMHYYKYRTCQILAGESLSEWDLVRAHGLVKAARWHRDLMVQANMRLIVSIVKKLPIDSHWFDELISDGAVALLRAVDKFDPSRGYRFCTYATTAIRRECFLHIKERHLDHRRHRDATHLAQRVERAPSPVDGAMPVEADRAHWLAWRERLSSMMSVLTRREQVIIRSRYCLGSHRRVKTLQRLSAALKISKERVRQLELGALAKLRAAAEMDIELEIGLPRRIVSVKNAALFTEAERLHEVRGKRVRARSG